MRKLKVHKQDTSAWARRLGFTRFSLCNVYSFDFLGPIPDGIARRWERVTCKRCLRCGNRVRAKAL